MPSVELIQLPDDRSLAAAAASDWWRLLGPGGQAGGFHVALSGGRIAGTFFDALVAGASPDPSLRPEIHFFWADERCVPPDHPDSSFPTARDRLFRPLGVPDSRIHRIPGELDPARGAAVAEQELLSVVGCRAGAMPVLDLVILGMGEDGHVASLFPGDDWEETHEAPVYRNVVASKPPPHRITLTYRMLVAAREVWVLASGRGKSEALGRSLLSTDTPLGRLRSRRDRLRIFCDF